MLFTFCIEFSACFGCGLPPFRPRLLNAKMIQMEMRLLGNTDRLGARPTVPFGFPSLSRLPSFLALTDRIADISAQLDAANSSSGGGGVNAGGGSVAMTLPVGIGRRPSSSQGGGPSASSSSSSSSASATAAAVVAALRGDKGRELSDALSDLEDQAWTMARALGLSSTSLPPLSSPALLSPAAASSSSSSAGTGFNQQSPSSTPQSAADETIGAWAQRALKLARFVDALRERGVAAQVYNERLALHWHPTDVNGQAIQDRQNLDRMSAIFNCVVSRHCVK